ncbi:MAG: ferredoxin [Candidatus Magasanikbacteria bacterium]|nr:ferredoxin [Candidatus Magasanikbacteria bacterium]
MKIIVDQEKCIGCGTCLALASKSFTWNAEGNKAVPIIPPGDEEKDIKEAAAACPVQAITLE